MWYIFNSKRKIAATCNHKPNIEDIESRGEFAIESDLKIDISKVGLDENDQVIEIPLPGLTKEEVLATLDNEYKCKFNDLNMAWVTAKISNDEELASEIASDREVLRTEYITKREAIA
jgi:hypothetical protein